MIKIFIVCHKPTYILKNELFFPIQVGAESAKERIPNMFYDDTGENISRKNPTHCELTAQYWAWKNIEAEYYGFFHYRRYFSFGKVYPTMDNGELKTKRRYCPYIELDDIRDDLSKYSLNKEEMEQIICRYDILTVLREKINTSVYQQYSQYHRKEPLDQVLRILKEKYPQYTKAADEYMNSKEIYYLNMFIMKKQLFMEYAAWLFNILEAYEQSRDCFQVRDEEKRLIGYLAERLFGIFYTYQRKNGAICAELQYLKFYYTDIQESEEMKRKSKENIRVFRLKPTKYEIKLDMRKLNRLFPANSRRRILLRSIFIK